MDDVEKLLENGDWRILIFKNGLGSYSAIATGYDSVDAAIREWEKFDGPNPFEGPNRLCGCGHTIEVALKAVAWKILHNRLPVE